MANAAKARDPKPKQAGKPVGEDRHYATFAEASRNSMFVAGVTILPGPPPSSG